MGVVRLEMLILRKITPIQFVSEIFNEQMLQKLSVILNQLVLWADFLSFYKFMNYSG